MILQKNVRNNPLEICMLDDGTIIVETGNNELDYTAAFDCLEEYGLDYELHNKRFKVKGSKKKLYKYLCSLTLFYNLFIY